MRTLLAAIFVALAVGVGIGWAAHHPNNGQQDAHARIVRVAFAFGVNTVAGGAAVKHVSLDYTPGHDLVYLGQDRCFLVPDSITAQQLKAHLDLLVPAPCQG